MAEENDPGYNEKLMAKIRHKLTDRIVPKTISREFHKYDVNVLTQQDLQKVDAVTNLEGDIRGATVLLERLPSYQNWFSCLLKVLQDPSVNMKSLADEIEKDAAELHAQFQTDQTYLQNGYAYEPSDPVYESIDSTYEKIDMKILQAGGMSITETEHSGWQNSNGDLDRTNPNFEGQQSQKLNYSSSFDPSLSELKVNHFSASAARPLDRLSETPEKQMQSKSFERNGDYDYASDSSDIFEMIPEKHLFQEGKDDSDSDYEKIGDIENLSESETGSFVKDETPVEEWCITSYESDEGEKLAETKQVPEKQERNKHLKKTCKHGPEYDFNQEDVAHALGHVVGWHPNISMQEIQEKLNPASSSDGTYLLCFLEQKKRPVLFVIFKGHIHSFVVHKKPKEDGSGQAEFYYIYQTVKTASTLGEIVEYHKKHGVCVTTKMGGKTTISLRHPVTSQ